MTNSPKLPQIPKKPIDRLLERLRFNKAKTYIPKDTRLLDIGAGDGSFLRFLNGHILSGVGIDPLITTTIKTKSYTLLPGSFPKDYHTDERFDVITLLAVVEHIPENELHKVADACWNYLTPYGRVIITVPHPFVDKILDVLKFFRIIKGLSLEEHHGFNPEVLPDIFNRWKLCKKERWEFGCNYLFIFEIGL
ncbi:class I SAM-dependent methyltransferase [Candidatus Poribacteria bacterium]|nr:class I SAM-dependent methyltransferase [Candidatus Poribacteria bacterium]